MENPPFLTQKIKNIKSSLKDFKTDREEIRQSPSSNQKKKENKKHHQIFIMTISWQNIWSKILVWKCLDKFHHHEIDIWIMSGYDEFLPRWMTESGMMSLPLKWRTSLFQFDCLWKYRQDMGFIIISSDSGNNCQNFHGCNDLQHNIWEGWWTAWMGRWFLQKDDEMGRKKRRFYIWSMIEIYSSSIDYLKESEIWKRK